MSYQAHEERVQGLLAERATRAKGEIYAASAVEIHKAFVNDVLRHDGSRPLSEEHLLQVVQRYVDMLRTVYGSLILEPHVLSDQALDAYGNSAQEDALHSFRMAQRRFIVYRSTKCDEGNPLTHWDRSLQSIWSRAKEHLAEPTASGSAQTYVEVKASQDPLQFSCSLQEGAWEAGMVTKEGIPDEAVPAEEIAACEAGTRPGRLYFTDGTKPNYDETGKPQWLPGLSCAVNDATNAMLPAPLRSCRGDSLLRFMRVESTGVATYTLFAPMGPATGLTAFHQETKQRRSFNCGTGDFIIQPLAVESHVRKLERLHELLLGAHGRHSNLLPLEMYLEENIPVVAYVRSSPHAEMVELPEQSCHAFISFATAHGTLPCIKVSCNDWCLRRELASSYLLERLVGACDRARPCEEDSLLEQDEEPGARSWWMEVVLVRTCEHLLDAARGLPDADAAWAGDTITREQASEALLDALPALRDLFQRTWSDNAIYGRGSKPAKAWHDMCLNFTRDLPSGGAWHDFWRLGAEERSKLVGSAESAADNPPDLGSLSLPELRQQWLLALQCHADAADEAGALKTRAPAALRKAAAAKLGRAFHHRSHVEACMDEACTGLLQQNAKLWGATQP
ncbi:hypothetical protein WJX73_009944 [Symbiochloris irregularis]|uniref:Uncharacterized protein n=1 Tax=Symbiochloris irregularis TaxID=706552 RepID=A0AAW1P736_9CHLO